MGWESPFRQICTRERKMAPCSSTGLEWARLIGSALRQGQRDGWGQRMLALEVFPTHLYVFPASHRKTLKSFKEDTIESHLHLRRINQGPCC